jgi:hypothetical protein
MAQDRDPAMDRCADRFLAALAATEMFWLLVLKIELVLF